MTSVGGTLAAGMQSLGQWGAATGLAVLEAGAMTYDVNTSSGRRVELPWGGSAFDFRLLTNDGRTMLRLAIEWAAGAGNVSGVVYQEFTELKSSSDVTSLAIALPSGTSAGDLLIACVAINGDKTSSLAPPTGWNLVDLGQSQGTITFGVWWKIAAVGDPSTQLFSWSTGAKGWGWMMRFTGHDASAPIYAFETAAGTSGLPTSQSITTSIDKAMILRLGGFDNSSVTVGNTGLAGHNTITMDRSGNMGGNVSGGAGHTSLMTAGDSVATTFALTSPQAYRTVTIAIAPDPAIVAVPGP